MVEVIRLQRRGVASPRPKTDLRLPLSNVIERIAILRGMARTIRAVDDKLDLERAAGRLEDELRRRGVDPTA